MSERTLADKMDQDVYRLAEWAQREAENQRNSRDDRRRWQRISTDLHVVHQRLYALLTPVERLALAEEPHPEPTP